MLKKMIMVLPLLILAIPTWCAAENIKTKDFQEQTGIESIKLYSPDILFPDYRSYGKIGDVKKAEKQGLENVKAGDYVTFSVRDDGSVKVTVASTGQSKSIQIIQ